MTHLPPSPQGSPWGSGAPSAWGAPVGPPPPPPQPRRRRRHRGGALPGVIVLVVALGAIVAAAVYGVNYLNPPPAREDGIVVNRSSLSVNEVEIGDCFDEPGGSATSELVVVPCDESHDAEVIYVTRFMEGRRAPYPGSEPLSRGIDESCTGAFSSYVGVAPANSTYEIGTLLPVQAAWEAGTRAALCYITDQSGQAWTGSAGTPAR